MGRQYLGWRSNEYPEVPLLVAGIPAGIPAINSLYHICRARLMRVSMHQETLYSRRCTILGLYER